MTSYYDPYSDRRAAIERRRKMADALREQSASPLESQMAGGYVVPISPLQGAAKLAQALASSKSERDAEAQEKSLNEEIRSKRSSALASALKGGQPDYQALVNSDDPELQNLGLELSIKAAERERELRQKTKTQVPAEEVVAMGYPQGSVLYRDALGDVKSDYIPKSAQDTEAPSNVQEWEYYSKLPPDQKEQFLTMKRAQKILDTGGGFSAVNPADPSQVTQVVEKTLAPADTPEAKAAAAAASAEGKVSGEVSAELADRAAAMPRLEQVAGELSELGKRATYTFAGQARDAVKRQLGMDVGEGAIARAEYIAKVDNEVLPLLRSTFGAQFTQKEGESLKATLGDPDKSPEEKDAVLRSFIKTKFEQIETLKRRQGSDAGWSIQEIP